MSNIIVPKRFINVHAHSHYSITDAMGTPFEHIDAVREKGMKSFVLTDHGTMAGFSPAFLYAKELNAKGEDFKFVGGCEMYLHPDLDEWEATRQEISQQKQDDKKKKQEEVDIESNGLVLENESMSKSKFTNPLNRRHHLVVLPKSRKGLENLFRLVSFSFKHGYYRYPRIDYKTLKKFGEDLIVSSACISGILPYSVFELFQDIPWDKLTPELLDDPVMLEKAVLNIGNAVDRLTDSVGKENVFAEIQFNKLSPQHLANRAIMEFCKRNNFQIVATCDSHYPRKELWKSREIYKMLGWMNYNNYTSDMIPKSVDELKCELYPKDVNEMWTSYKKYCYHDFYDDTLVAKAIETGHDIVFDMIGDVSYDTEPKLPSSVIPSGKSSAQALIELCKKGLEEKNLIDKPEYIQRLKEEIKVVHEKGFESYFLLMSKLVEVSKKAVMLGPGRGSSSGSLINYLLHITQLDPIRHDLLFARFIAKSRNDYPDIDSDFSDRDALIDELKKEFGEESVLKISNYNTLKLKSLVKDVSKFLGIPFDEVNKVTKVVEPEVKAAIQKPGDDKNLFELNYDDAIKHSKTFKEFLDKYPELGEIVPTLIKQNRSIGAHAGGIVILDDPDKYIPVIKVRDQLQVPWVEGLTLKTLEKIGILKIDALGLDTLRVVQRCIEKIIQHKLGSLLELEIDNKKFQAYELQSITLSDGSSKLIKDLNENDDIKTPVEIQTI